MAYFEKTKDFMGKLGTNEIYFWSIAISAPIFLIIGIVMLFANRLVTLLLSILMILSSSPGWYLRFTKKTFKSTWIPLLCMAVTLAFVILLIVTFIL